MLTPSQFINLTVGHNFPNISAFELLFGDVVKNPRSYTEARAKALVYKLSGKVDVRAEPPQVLEFVG